MRAWSLKDTVRFYGFPDELVAYYQNAEFVQELNLRHEKLFRSLFYLGPLRTKAERLYSWGGVNPESVGFSGENTVAAILSARNRKISLGYKRQAKPFEEIIAQKLKEMGLIEEFKVNPISEQRQEYEVKVRAKGSKDWVDSRMSVLVFPRCFLCWFSVFMPRRVDHPYGAAGNSSTPECPVGIGRCDD